jgi:hypothetical protein
VHDWHQHCYDGSRMRFFTLALAMALAASSFACASADDASGSQDDFELQAEVAVTGTAEHDAWAAFIRKNGGHVHPGGRATVVSLRGFSSERIRHEVRSERVWNELFVILTTDGRALLLSGSTHPWESASKSAPDANADGVPDVGMVRPGEYLAHGRGTERLTGGLPAYEVMSTAGSGFIPSYRDTNHDGVFDSQEIARSTTRGDRMSAVLFHRSGGGGAPAAIGCQVFDEAAMADVVVAVGGASARFNYLLVDAANLPDASIP